ncbi:MAG: hypothetical protein KAJ91_02270 [Candidatus Aenigmarchaeota archaeon]|nr:hypothetical protein [Candidatus Aenigmarchaeota archaeon]
MVLREGGAGARFTAVLIVALIVSIAGPVAWGLYFNSSDSAAEKVKALYELANPGVEFEVLSANEESGMYKIALKATTASETNFKEVYVTKDGKLLSEGMVMVEKSTEDIGSAKNFVDCLYDNGLRVYGVLDQSFSAEGASATSMQLQMLGMYSGKIYVSCDGQFMQGCVDLGLQQVPSVVYNNTAYNGVKDVAWLEQVTGCKL